MDRYNKEIYEQITALVDNEVPEGTVEELQSKIDMSDELQFEYKVQSEIKTLLQNRFSANSAPAYLYENVLNRIMMETKIDPPAKNTWKTLLQLVQSILRPKFVFAALVLIAAIFLISTPFRTINLDELANQQHGKYNIWVQANSNFNSIIEGKLTAQFISNDPGQIQGFFSENGVEYETEIPICENWNLAGGVVSEDKGEKFAHHVYSNQSGNILYVYQVSVESVGKSGVLNLSDDLLSFLSEEKIYKYSYSDHSTFLVKSHDNFFAVVSNDDPSKVESDFISQIL
jgi:hypothetical protein